MNFKNKMARLAVVAPAVLLASGAKAAAIDVTAVVTSIGDTLAPVGLIGVAVLSVIVAIKAFKWVRQAF